MSRAFSPPDTLSQDDIRTVADVRRAVWINGLFGLGAGTVTGMVGHLVLQSLQRRYVGDLSTENKSPMTKAAAEKAANKSNSTFLYKLLRPLPPLTKNTFLLSLLSGGALGSFLFSTTAGKNAVHLLHPIFNVGRDEYAGKSPYQIAMAKAAASQQDQQQQQNEHTESILTAAIEQDELDIQHHKQRTLRRKASIQRRIESGHSLSDTHSTLAHYQHPITITTEEESQEKAELQEKSNHRAELWERRQTNRRQWVHDKITTGGSLSDSHVHYNSEKEVTNDGEEGVSRRAEAFRRRQTDRRRWVQDKIVRGGGGMSNSTGGHWVEEEEE